MKESTVKVDKKRREKKKKKTNKHKRIRLLRRDA
jgi:hypothetical protein